MKRLLVFYSRNRRAVARFVYTLSQSRRLMIHSLSSIALCPIRGFGFQVDWRRLTANEPVPRWSLNWLTIRLIFADIFFFTWFIDQFKSHV